MFESISDLITTPERPVMCCICFETFAIEDLNPLPEGGYEDVCRGCAKSEHDGLKA